MTDYMREPLTEARTRAKRHWATDRYAKASEQTRQDIDAIVAALKVNAQQAAETFMALAHTRNWMLWESAAIRDIAITLFATEEVQ